MKPNQNPQRAAGAAAVCKNGGETKGDDLQGASKDMYDRHVRGRGWRNGLDEHDGFAGRGRRLARAS